jgi:glycosyltransferase involved in cell wall biosynthesis
MKISLDINPTLKSSSAGLGSFTLNLIKALKMSSSELELILYYEKKLFNFKKKAPKFKYNKITYYNGYKKEKPQADIHLTSCYDYEFPKEGKFVLVIHDLIPLVASEFASSDARDTLLKLLPEKLNRADAIVCISKNTLNDLLKFYPFSESKAFIIYNSVDPSFKKIQDKKELTWCFKKMGIEDGYLLFVSAIEKRKNLIALLRTFSIVKEKFPELKLVVAGKKSKDCEEIDNFVEKSPYKKDIIFLGYVKQKDLVYLYNGAGVFIYPSFYEGFGLPIVEAFACETPVVTSNVSSMKEIAEGAAELVDPYNPKDIAASIIKILNDQNYRNELINKGLKKAEEFSPLKMGRSYLGVFKDLLRMS